MITKVNAELDNYDRVFIGDLDLAYTYFAYYTPFQPQDFQEQAHWRKDGFLKVDEYRKYQFSGLPSFAEFTPDNVDKIFDDQHKKILVLGRGEAARDIPVLWEQADWRGRTLWYAFVVDLKYALARLQALPPVPPRLLVIDYLLSCQSGSCNTGLFGTDLQNLAKF